MSKKTLHDPSSVNIAALKANLARYLRRVEAGEAITVLDRMRPIARLVGIRPGEETNLVMIPARKDPMKISDVKIHKVNQSLPDVVELLMEDRRKR